MFSGLSVRSAAVLIAAAILSVSTSAQAQLHIEHRGYHIFSETPPAEVIDGVRTTPAEDAAEHIRRMVDEISSLPELVQNRINYMRQYGNVVIAYDARLPDSNWNSINLATFFPDYFNPAEDRYDFVVVIGRTGIQWDIEKMSGVIAHELAGHAFQHAEERLLEMRVLDAECEAYLIEELSIQHMGVAKSTDEYVDFRRALEQHWCSDFRRYTRTQAPEVHGLWEERDPDVPRLLSAFADYVATGG